MSFIVMLKSVNDVIVYKRSDKSTIAKVQKYSKVAELLLLLYECHHLGYDYSLSLYKKNFLHVLEYTLYYHSKYQRFFHVYPHGKSWVINSDNIYVIHIYPYRYF